MAARRFTISGYELDGSCVRVRVEGDRGAFTEELDLGVELWPDDATHRLARLLSVAVATSYAKLDPFDELCTPELADEEAAYTAALYDHGLREYRFENGLPLDRPPVVRAEARPWTDGPVVASRSLPGGFDGMEGPDRPALVAIGGGKDSALTLRVVDPAVAACVNPSPAVVHLCAAAGVELRGIARRLDPRLAEATAAGGLNGHVPVTAINSAALALLAHHLGAPDVVFANERSAEEPTRVVDGTEVNHQWSKTLAFEERFAALVAETGLRYWSLTRGMSDLGVAARVVGDGKLLDDFLSCNRAYRLADIAAGVDNRGAWCGACDKCAFTFLTFAVFLPPERLVGIFGRDLLADRANVGLVAALATPGAKPFDCVGEIDESRAALGHLARSEAWGAAPVVAALAGLGSSAPPVEVYLPITDDRVPGPVRAALEAVPVAPPVI